MEHTSDAAAGRADGSSGDNCMLIPGDASVRRRIECQARDVASDLGCKRLPDRGRLEELALGLLDRLGLDHGYQGFAMVAIGTEFCRTSFAAAPFSRRLLLLPHCLRSSKDCKAPYSATGLHCAQCGSCSIGNLLTEARALGYQTLVAEGTPAVVQTLAGGHVEAILGVACLDSLEKCFDTVQQLGVPYAGVPLVRDGCRDTEADIERIREILSLHVAGGAHTVTGYITLLQKAGDLFAAEYLKRLLAASSSSASAAAASASPQTETVAHNWLGRGGKRFRPFITLAAYAATRGFDETRLDRAAVDDLVSDPVASVAVALESFHKASLVHDDVEDRDAYRYGEPTLHARYGEAMAINTGDYLVGLGYHLVAAQAGALGADCVADILATLSSAHLKLCRGQGTELLLTGDKARSATADDVLTLYALKTAPAFSAAMYAGMRMAGPLGDDGPLVDAFCRHLGVAYQVLDDLDDLSPSDDNHRLPGQDIVARRPTMLLAFASADGVTDRLDALFRPGDAATRRGLVDDVRDLYRQCGAVEKASRLVDKCRERATQIAEQTNRAALGNLMRFLTRVVLRDRDF
ncbi:MAG: polyprenyl synthetase family protein [Planctomycetes bacterium]|nr:polyprenyl synthetase family protein [Planctomycetota bacterium]